jgi:ketol-acid reductoisomerase
MASEILERNTFESQIFDPWLQTVQLGDTVETVMAQPERDLTALAEAFGDVGQVAIIGYSSQGHAQAPNLRDSLKAVGSDTNVVVGLRTGSGSRPKAEAAGFDMASGTLMTVEEAVRESDMTIFLISDGAMADDGEKLIGLAKSGATIGLSHGFYLGHLATQGKRFRDDVNLVGMCPKGMGPSVLKLYQQGSGINSSVAVEQGGQKELDLALGWGAGIGSPYIFRTTLDNERKSDLVGERAILLGGVHGLVEAAYAWKVQKGVEPHESYMQVVETIVGPISDTISRHGLMGVYESLDSEGKERFEAAYEAAYPNLLPVMEKIYADVSSGREVAEVVEDNRRNMPMTNVNATYMWQVGEKVRANHSLEDRKRVPIDPEVAGLYIAAMMAQVDVFRRHGHPWSEVVNESIIEAVDSLNPFMQASGLGRMVDGCSITARRGDRKWASLWSDVYTRAILPVIDHAETPEGADSFGAFKTHQVHQVLSVLGGMRPPIRIAVE